MPRWLPRALARIHRLAAQGKVQFTEKALRELDALGLGLHESDGVEVVRGLTARECAGRVFSPESAEWLCVFRPLVAGTALYVKLVLRAHCVVISFHGGESGDENED
jgi:hypothetical protein